MLPLGGCLLTGDRPEPGLDIPANYDRGPRDPALAESALPPLDWWRGFRSKELTEIIEEARAANLDIAGGDRPHRAGRRHGARHRRGFVADRRSRRQCHALARLANHDAWQD